MSRRQQRQVKIAATKLVSIVHEIEHADCRKRKKRVTLTDLGCILDRRDVAQAVNTILHRTTGRHLPKLKRRAVLRAMFNRDELVLVWDMRGKVRTRTAILRTKTAVDHDNAARAGVPQSIEE